ncbi:hypothetical protein Tco_0679447 [Tanacetum coccineum]|uniref:Uncharacterized protein n=1 Tax=Tanacetum coccineum TaxID=301880 RepID=A0ABQ4XIU0_9ASTR
MSCSTISYESIAESMGSSIASAMVPYPAPNDDSESEPFEDPASPGLLSDYFDILSYFNSVDRLGRGVSPTVSVASDPDDEPLGSPDTTDYYGGRSRSSSPLNSPHSLSPHHKRCRVSPTPSLPTAGELAVIEPALPSMPIKLLPPRKRFTTIERIKTLEIEVKSLTARLIEAEI